MRVADQHAHKLASYAGKPVVIGLRPENIALGPPAGGSPTDNLVTAIVEVVEPIGPETYLYLTTGAHSFVARLAAAEETGGNHKLSLSFDLSKSHFLDPATELAIV